jgi:hypothetical protein
MVEFTIDTRSEQSAGWITSKNAQSFDHDLKQQYMICQEGAAQR